MSAYAIEQSLPGLTSEHSGATAPVAPRRHDAEASLAGVWLMIATILGCLAGMAAVVLVAATAVP